MSKNKKYHQLYDRLLQEVEMLHERIKVGIRQGLKMLVIVPLLFMLVMFLTQGSKGIFLVLWIVSSFVIAAFLIALEYVDHGIQKRLEEITGMENTLPEDSIMPDIELPEIDIEELRLIAQDRRNQLPLHKLKEKLAAEDTGEAPEESAEAEAVQEAAEPIVEVPFIFEELPDEKAEAAEELEPELAEAMAEGAAEAVQAADEVTAGDEKAGETEDAEDVVKV